MMPDESGYDPGLIEVLVESVARSALPSSDVIFSLISDYSYGYCS